MTRRRSSLVPLVVSLLAAGVSLGFATTARAEIAPLWSATFSGDPRLVADSGGAWSLWETEAAGVSTITAQRVEGDGETRPTTPVALVTETGSIETWRAVSDGAWGVVLCWKAGGTTYVRRFNVDGIASYAAVAVCSDAGVAAARGAGAAAAPAELTGGLDGGVYVALAATPSLGGTGDSYLNHVSGAGVLAVADPGLAPTSGTAQAITHDSEGRLVALLAPPGRANLAVQSYETDAATQRGLKSRWTVPVSPYGLLSSPRAGATLTPVAVLAGGSGGCLVVWREESEYSVVRVQRLTAAGLQAWRTPTRVLASGEVLAAGDGFGGCHILSLSTGNAVHHHYDVSGTSVEGATTQAAFAAWASSMQPIDPEFGDAATDGAGDLSVAFADTAAPARSSILRFTYLGVMTSIPLDDAALGAAQLAADAQSGLYTLAGDGSSAVLRRLGYSDLALTLRSQVVSLQYGRSAQLRGSLVNDAAGLGGKKVALRWTSRAGGPERTATSVLSGAFGAYVATVTPKVNATWRAVAPNVTGGPAVSETIAIGVMPTVGLSLAHARTSGTLTEYFSGRVRPLHTGYAVKLQRRAGGTWKTIKTARLNASSRYRIAWRVPRRTATYTVRVVLPAHSDHLRGTSVEATLRVKAGR